MISKYQQRKRGFNNILMFVGLMAMAMVAWLDYKDRLPERRPNNTGDAVAINQISFNNANNIRTELSFTEGQWMLLSPVNLPARNSRIKRLLELNNFDFSEGFDAGDVNLEAAGLDDSARVLSLNQNNYLFGQIEPVSSKRYIQLNKKVLLLEDRYLPLMDGGLNALAELRLPFEDTTAIKLADDKLLKDQLSHWQNAQAMGVRSATSSPQTATLLVMQGDNHINWSAWPDKGLWVLQPQGTGYEYLISAAQAATLGLVQQ